MANNDTTIDINRNVTGVVNAEPNAEVNQIIYNTINPNELITHIKKEDIDKLTQRFYRTELSRNRNIQGFGLGLSIVSKALEVIGGEIRFESKENQGTIVEVFINV